MFAAFAAGQQSLGMRLGFINDLTGVVTLPLAVPAMVVLHDRLRPTAGRSGDALLVLAIGATIAIVLLQLLLVTRVPDVRAADRPGVARVPRARRVVHRDGPPRVTGAGLLPHGTRLGVLAASYAGYPVWAFRLARALRDGGTG